MSNRWIRHVKKVMEEKGITYREALQEAKKTYKPIPFYGEEAAKVYAKKYKRKPKKKEEKGGSLKDAWELWKKDGVPVYGPAIRAGLKGAIAVALDTAAIATGMPEVFVPVATGLANALKPIVDILGNKTGAFSIGEFKGNKKERMEMEDTIRFRNKLNQLIMVCDELKDKYS